MVTLFRNITGFESSSTPLTDHLSPQIYHHHCRTLHFDQAQRTRYSKGGFASKYNGLREQFDFAHRPPQPSETLSLLTNPALRPSSANKALERWSCFEI